MTQIEYIYDSQGEVSAVRINGTERNLSDLDKDFAPERVDTAFHDVSASVKSTSSEIEKTYKKGSILIGVEATHYGYVNQNFYHYNAKKGKDNLSSWTKPYGKPYVVDHDLTGPPKGRVQDAKYVATGSSTGYHFLTVKVGDKEEIEMILDSRALTVSAGSKPAGPVLCSNCQHTINDQEPKRYKLDNRADKTWLEKKAPSFYGEMGLTNEELWQTEETKDGHYATCRHIRGLTSPNGEQVYWDIHDLEYKELSRVNQPADFNAATGEFAHIREVLKFVDSLDDDTKFASVISTLSYTPDNPTNRRFVSIATEDSVWEADSITEAVIFAERSPDSFFDSNLWAIIDKTSEFTTLKDKVQEYIKQGGRFIRPEDKPLTPKQALALTDVKEFTTWLKDQTEFTDAEKRLLDKLFARKLLRN